MTRSRPAIIMPPTPKKRDPKLTTAVSGATGEVPLFECNVHEMLGIRKFLIYAIEDTKLQVQKSLTPGVPVIHAKRIREAGEILTAWAIDALAMCDEMLQQAALQGTVIDKEKRTGDPVAWNDQEVKT